MREEVERLKGKIDEVRKEVNIKSKNRAEGGRSRNGVTQVRLNNVRAKSEKGLEKQGERIKVERGGSKKVKSCLLGPHRIQGYTEQNIPNTQSMFVAENYGQQLL